MTEAEWLTATDPTPMLEFVNYKISNRDRLLFGCACCRRVVHLLTDLRSRLHLDAVESGADRAERALSGNSAGTLPTASGDPDDYAQDAALMAVTYLNADPTRAAWRAAVATAAFQSGRALEDDDDGWKHEYHAERVAQADILRCQHGSQPFRPVAVDPDWLTSTVVALARQMYEARDFFAMPILADALQDAGCDNDDILTHCRGDGPHVRGCWVVDLVLGKE